ncbi:siderophore-iron reductase FhuF [Ancylobacter oerskovii]|uniref:Siderophore-iron reductase FhuF n=1 Tax=Ancylobacter oerskovii TaxID=459519 RepID=A0ABW4YWH5_9HYPH|nr:siderophore-iron reductase FhuF [Ancylobacter oerskovii]MBS7544137.1 siderophore-iron reductase FhuF [Ancylobacter oerskovii]
MIPELAPLFRGPLEEIGATLFVDDGTAPRDSLAALLAADRLAAELARFAARYAEPEPRAVASQWSKLYFTRLAVPAMVAAIAADWRLPLAPERLGVVLDGQGGIAAFSLPHAGAAQPAAQARQRFGFLVDAHLPLVVDSLARASGLSRRVLWSNAGNLIETVVERCAELLGDEHPGVRHGRELLAGRRFAEGDANPLFEPVRYMADGTRLRRVCCIRYLIPALAYCKTCPLER